MVHTHYPKRCRSSSLAETVASIEGLLTEILLRVPATSVLRFKCVSKHWHSIISDPKFHLLHTQQNPNSPISAVFPVHSIDFSLITFPPHHKHISARWNPLEVIANQYGDIYIMHSCNGLLLCRPRGAPTTLRSPYFVLNPTTNQFSTFAIPRICQQFETHITGCFLAFDPSKSPHYKVFCLETIDGREIPWHYRIQIYSSETRSWRHLKSCINWNYRISYERGVYSNGAIHWMGMYSDMSYFHIDEERLGFVKSTRPCNVTYQGYRKNLHVRKSRHFRESSDGHLHLIDIYGTCYTNFDVLEMGRDYSGWFVKYNVDLDPVCHALPYLGCGEFVVLFLDRDENEEDGSLSLLLHTRGKVISCDLENKTFKSFRVTTDRHLLVDHRNITYKETLASV